MNKAFVREPEHTADYCPRCGSKGEAVGIEALKSYLTDEQRHGLTEPVNFCPSPKCGVAYFDGLERVVMASELARPVYPKDPTAPICACFGLTRQDIEQDVAEGVIVVLAPQIAGMSTADISRIIQGTVTGIGFIGGGVILKQSEHRHIEGITTA